MVKEKTLAIIIVVLCTLLTSLGQLFLKFGSARLSFNLYELITNYWLIGGMILYGSGAILLIFALKFGELSVVYPIISLSFIWVTLLSVRFLNEEMGIIKLGGIAFILLGVSFIGVGSKK